VSRATPTRGLLLAQAVAVGLVISVPTALVNVLLAAQDPAPKAWLNLTLLVLLLGFVVAGIAAGVAVDVDAARTGAVVGFLVFVPVEVIGLLGRADRGDPIVIGGIIFLAGLAAVAGTIGGLIGARRRPKGDQP
jgi:putative membrane protein (TIGR04086 family)